MHISRVKASFAYAHVGASDAAEKRTAFDEALKLCVYEILDWRVLRVVMHVSEKSGRAFSLIDEWAEGAIHIWQALGNDFLERNSLSSAAGPLRHRRHTKSTVVRLQNNLLFLVIFRFFIAVEERL